jgi:hypothetical protein
LLHTFIISSLINNHPFISRHEHIGQYSQAIIATWYVCYAIIVGTLPEQEIERFCFCRALRHAASSFHDLLSLVMSTLHPRLRLKLGNTTGTEFILPRTLWLGQLHIFIFIVLMIACFGRRVMALWIGWFANVTTYGWISWSARSAYPFGPVYCYRYHSAKSRIQLLLFLCSILLLNTPAEEGVRAKGEAEVEVTKRLSKHGEQQRNVEPWLVKQKAGV